jgi:5,6,7,8-tetrahydromethanopterin hydro-lyase
MTGFVTQIGEAFVGAVPKAAHLNTVLGTKGGPVETAWVTALATPRAGHAAFLTTLRPGVPAKPMTLFVNKATLEGDAHSTMTWGPAQGGDDALVYENNRTATRDALAAGARRLPTLDEALEFRDRALNAYYLPPGVTGKSGGPR